MFHIRASASVFFLVLLSALTPAKPVAETVSGYESPPASLDSLYPPKARAPLFLRGMHELNATFTGIVVDLFENDHAGVLANFESFQSQYRENAALVPEWADRYPSEPVEALGKIISGGSPDEVMAEVNRVGAICHDCHLATMVPVQQKYRWPDFQSITVEDPIRMTDLPYPEFMQMLNTSLTGIGIDVAQGQVENARMHLGALATRMASLKEICSACHDTERTYFVDARIDSLLGRMTTALQDTEVDPGAVGRLSQEIGMESCSKCHLVHVPAAYGIKRGP